MPQELAASEAYIAEICQRCLRDADTTDLWGRSVQFAAKEDYHPQALAQEHFILMTERQIEVYEDESSEGIEVA